MGFGRLASHNLGFRLSLASEVSKKCYAPHHHGSLINKIIKNAQTFVDDFFRRNWMTQLLCKPFYDLETFIDISS